MQQPQVYGEQRRTERLCGGGVRGVVCAHPIAQRPDAAQTRSGRVEHEIELTEPLDGSQAIIGGQHISEHEAPDGACRFDQAVGSRNEHERRSSRVAGEQ